MKDSQRGIGSALQLELLASSVLNRVRICLGTSNWGKTEPWVCKEVSERWRRKSHGLGDVFCSRSWASYTDTWESECKCLSEPPSATCSSFPASISQSACNFHAGLYSSHTAKQVKQFLEAENIEIIEMARPEFWSKPDWKPLAAKLSLSNPLQSLKTKITPAQCEKLVMCWSHSKQEPLHFLLISDSCNPQNFSCNLLLCYSGYCYLILITVSTK